MALARVLALKPEFIVADEPTAALDLSVQAQVLSLVKMIQKKTNLTLLFISHDLQIIEQMCDTVAVMHEGRIVERGTPRGILHDPKDPYTRKLVDAAYRARRGWEKSGLRTSKRKSRLRHKRMKKVTFPA